ncbi:hypothetical protein KCU90_g3733, partial [Aureobasidium melanogenum]
MADHHEIDMQFVGEVGDLVDRMAKRKMPLRGHAAFGEPVHAFLQNVAGRFLETAAGHIGQQAGALRNARAHVDHRQQVRFRFQIQRQVGAAT